MLRVLMTTDTVGGVWTYSTDLARELRGHGVDVILATMGKPLTREQRATLRAMPGVEARESSYRLEWMEDPWRDVRDAGEWLLSLAAESQPDLVHLNGFCHGALPWNRPTLIVAHSDVFSWFRAARKQEPGPEWRR